MVNSVSSLTERRSGSTLACRGARFDNFVVGLTLIHLICIFQMVDSSLTVEATSDNLVCHYKLIKFLLQIVVLESEQIGMVL